MTSSWLFSFSLAPSLEKAWNTWNAPEGRWTINEWWAWTRLWKPQWKVHPSSEGLQHVMSFGNLVCYFCANSVVTCQCSDVHMFWSERIDGDVYEYIYIYMCIYTGLNTYLIGLPILPHHLFPMLFVHETVAWAAVLFALWLSACLKGCLCSSTGSLFN